MPNLYNPLAISASTAGPSPHQQPILACSGTGRSLPSSHTMLQSSFLLHRDSISPSKAHGVTKPGNSPHIARIVAAEGRRHHRRRDDFDEYMRAREKPQQQASERVQMKSEERRGGVDDKRDDKRGGRVAKRGGRDDKVVITLDLVELKHRAADTVVVAQRAAEQSMRKSVRFVKDAALESGEVLRELSSSVRIQRDRNVVISVRRSSLEFAGKAVVGCVLLVLFGRLFLGAVRKHRWGWGEGFGGLRVVRDRSLGGKEVALNSSKGVKLWEGGPAKKAVSGTRAGRGPLDMPVEDSRSEKELQRLARDRGEGAPAVKREPRLPGWWPEADLPPSTLLSTRQRAEEESSRLVHGIMQKRLVGSDFSADDILQLRQLCKASGSKVKFDTYNTRDSFYRAAINIVLSACQRAGKWSTADFGSEDSVRFIAGLAANVGLESDRAATMVNAAVAARTRAGLLQARALHMQSKRSESEEELLKLIRLHSCFPPDPDSAEMEMVARGLGSHFDREGRVQMLQMYQDLGGVQTKGVAEEALGLLLTD